MDKRDIDHRSDDEVKQLQQAAGNGTGGFISAEQYGDSPIYRLSHRRHQTEVDGQSTGNRQHNRGDDEGNRHSKVKDNRETEDSDFTDIKQYRGERHVSDLPVVTLS